MTSLSFPTSHHTPFTPPSVRRYRYHFRQLTFAVSRNRETVMKKAEQHLRNSRDAVKLNGDDNLRLTPDQSVGTVVSAQANFMRVVIKPNKLNKLEHEEEYYGVELLCSVRSLLKKIKRRVLVGGTVLLRSINWTERSGMIENVFERRTEVTDPPVANVDHLLVMFSLDQPIPEAKTLTRFLVEAESTKLPFTLALNKADLVDKKTVTKWKTILRIWGYEPIICSVETKTGLDSLQLKLTNQTSVIMGPSGVRKSSLINALRSDRSGFGSAEADDWPNSISGMKINVSVKCQRKLAKESKRLDMCLCFHYLVEDMLLILLVRKILSNNELSRCAFSNCLHIEEPGCVVKLVWCVEEPACCLEEPAWCLVEPKCKRYKHYSICLKRSKFKMGDMGIKQAEPRLDPKKHRRQSRKTTNQSILNDLENELEDDDDESYLDDDPIMRAMETETQ
ncbi:small ribosomal subunit biogenesis GTPase RsgA 1, mitochondrial-like [Bidens hawaiensis]|uniref:small ribosomal subunit biogenesis GTPase RsgA 1, mitochondrial-like n=1 Tax=Bidens hawaiensis TaxID=980011 RepID=UPI00404A933A